MCPITVEEHFFLNLEKTAVKNLSLCIKSILFFIGIVFFYDLIDVFHILNNGAVSFHWWFSDFPVVGSQLSEAPLLKDELKRSRVYQLPIRT